MAQREFFAQRRKPTNEISNADSIEAKLEVCKEAKSIAEMAAILPSKDLKLLASLSNETFSPPIEQAPTILQPKAVYPTQNPHIFTSLPPNRALSIGNAECVSPPPNTFNTNLREEIASSYALYHDEANESTPPSLFGPFPSFEKESSLWHVDRPTNPMPPTKKYKLQ